LFTLEIKSSIIITSYGSNNSQSWVQPNRRCFSIWRCWNSSGILNIYVTLFLQPLKVKGLQLFPTWHDPGLVLEPGTNWFHGVWDLVSSLNAMLTLDDHKNVSIQREPVQCSFACRFSEVEINTSELHLQSAIISDKNLEFALRKMALLLIRFVENTT